MITGVPDNDSSTITCENISLAMNSCEGFSCGGLRQKWSQVGLKFSPRERSA